MPRYLVTGIAPVADPGAINKTLRAAPALAGVRFTIVGSSARGDVASQRGRAYEHTGIVEVIEGGSAYPQSGLHTGQSGTGVPGINASSPSITFIEHPTVFDYLCDLELPYDLAVNYNLAIEVGRSVVVCAPADGQVLAVEAAFHENGLRNVHSVAAPETAVASA